MGIENTCNRCTVYGITCRMGILADERVGRIIYVRGYQNEIEVVAPIEDCAVVKGRKTPEQNSKEIMEEEAARKSLEAYSMVNE